MNCAVCYDEKSSLQSGFCSNDHSERICKECLQNWISSHESCPLCRAEIYRVKEYNCPLDSIKQALLKGWTFDGQNRLVAPEYVEHEFENYSIEYDECMVDDMKLRIPFYFFSYFPNA